VKNLLTALACTTLLAACGGDANDVAEDQVEDQAEASAAAAGPSIAALGLTEAQLLEADLVGTDNVDLGDVTRLNRAADGSVESLLIEIEDSNPDRYVSVPIAGLTTVTRGDDIDLATTMSRDQIQALPEVTLSPAPMGSTPPAPASATPTPVTTPAG
jgi:hypothetical protein